ncbi:MAG: hypothetical protein JWQ28_1768, partial [Pedobacter sp.]|nr:hypothetical protein [Pedobacter sp.]
CCLLIRICIVLNVKIRHFRSAVDGYFLQLVDQFALYVDGGVWA